MHSTSTFFSMNNESTIEPLLSSASIGRTGHLSGSDILLINAIYPNQAAPS
ncbi:hypothetical protein [Pararhizobium gei]|uniref:hypothetical protein n=1 Tax=Pararhizobium gei TaxID=1395951 RepID=UPI003312FB81